MSERSSEPPAISVVMPARNAAPYLTGALESLAAQTHKQWEAIVVDDGSTDDTAAIVDRRAIKDERIRLVQRPGRGVSAARNAGIEMARHEWLVFLDADDWLAPDHLARMAAAVGQDSGVDLVYCSWVRVPAAGPHGPVCCREPLADPFLDLAQTCRLAVHSGAVRRSLVRAVGGFDETLRTCEDWDLWIRIARAGRQFVHVSEVLAFYRLRPDSACANALRLLNDGIEVLCRARSRDDRVPNAPGSKESAAPAHTLATSVYALGAWTAGIAIGKGQDPMHLLGPLEGKRAPDLSPWLIASTLVSGLPLGMGRFDQEWPTLWPLLLPSIETYLSEIERISRATHLQARTLRVLERLILEAINIAEPVTIGAAHAVRVDVNDTIGDMPTPDNVDRLICFVDCDGQLLGRIELPTFGAVSGQTIAAAIMQRFGRQLLRRRRGRLPLDLDLLLSAGRHAVTKRGLAIAAKLVVGKVPGRRALSRAYRRELRDAAAQDLGLARAGHLGEKAAAAIERAEAIKNAEQTKACAEADRDLGKPRAAAMRSSVLRDEPVRPRRDQETHRLPILMYHRVAADGPGPLARFRVTPDAFSSQLAWLRDHGFHSVPLETWHEAILSQKPLHGRPVAITFDDGYTDIAVCAAPLLRKYGFSATIFVPSDFAGGSAEWDRDEGPPAPLLSWAQMRQLQAAGLDFGAHGTLHRPLTALSAEAMLRDGVRAKATLERRLECAITAIAYPHGDYDEVVNRVMEACGYSCGLTIEPRCSNIWDDPLCLPRIEIAGGDTLDDFAAKLAM